MERLIDLWILFGACAMVLAAPIARMAALKPVITTDFPDPSIIQVGGTWYAFGTQSAFDYKDIKVQIATSPDFKTWTVTGKDALVSLPNWVRSEDPAVWAPNVVQLPNGRFLMHFSANIKQELQTGPGLFHCVGTALSDSISGPYTPTSDTPFACDLEQGGSIDASSFLDTDGKMYVLYKIDANSMGNGGVCNNGIPPLKSTPIMIQQVSPSDGTTKIGNPVQLITNTDRDGPLVEAPYMVKTSDDMYVLFFSSNCYTTKDYDVSYATSRNVMGPFSKTTTPLFITGTQGLIGPGGASVTSDGHVALHGYEDEAKVGGVRAMFVTKVKFGGRKVKGA